MFMPLLQENFKLFGINIPYNKSIKAHSDGDVGVSCIN